MSNTRHRTIKQGLACTETFDEYCVRIQMDDEAKLEASLKSFYAASKMIAEYLPIIYEYGGRDKWLLQTLYEDAGIDIYKKPEIKYKVIKNLKASLKKAVFERDAYRCKHCETHIDLTVDHIYPKSKGGIDDLDNLQTLCRPCNSKKGAKVVSNEQ